MHSSCWTLYNQTEINFGRGSIQHLGRILRRHHFGRIMIVADQNLVQVGIVEKITSQLEQTGCDFEVYCGEIEPSTRHAEELVELAASFQPDAWIGLGGGSNMDLAKLACAAVSHQMPPADLFGYDALAGPIRNLICIPTTAGTGSEVSHAAIIKNLATGHKMPVLSQFLRPPFAVIDPSLTDGCPAQVSAESGIDALTHAIEAYLAKSHLSFKDDYQTGLPYEGSHVLSDMMAEKALELIGQNLVLAVNEPQNQSARDGMALAALLAGVAFSSAGVTLVHALEYWVGDRYPCSHGAGNGILLPQVMEFYKPKCAERLARIAHLLAPNPTGSNTPHADANDPDRAIEIVRSLRAAIHLPARLGQVGAKAEDLSELAKSAFALERLINLAPRLTTEDDLLSILTASL